MLQCVLRSSLNSSFSFCVPNCRRKMMLIPNAYKIIIQTFAGYFSEIHFPRLSYLMEVSQINGCSNHLGLCSLLFPSPKSCPAISAPFLLCTFLYNFQDSVKESLSPGSLLQFPHAASSHFPSVSQFFSPTSTISFCYIFASLTRLRTFGGPGPYLLHLSISIA